MSCVVSLAVFALAAGCKENMAQDKTTPKRDINAVLRDHDKELLAVPGVVGVYVGALEDGRTPCLKIMLARRTPEAERQIPRLIEGYRVVQEVTGEIRPLGTP
ncbi:MAG: hypothetical protein V7609_1390 [Verrucomicrobiota bacterium]